MRGARGSLLFAAWLGSAMATADERPVSYDRDVRPILQAHCHGCHQPAKVSGKIVLTSPAELLTASKDDQKLVAPHHPEDSLLYQVIQSAEGMPAIMPKDRPALNDVEVATIRRWIEAGAVDDSPAAPRFDAEHPPVYRLPPVLTSLDFSQGGAWLAVSGHHEVLVFTSDGERLAARLIGLSERIESLRFSPDDRFLAVGGGIPARMGELSIWSVETFALRLSVPVTFDTIRGVSWSPDGRHVAFGCCDNTVRALDSDTGAQVLYQGAHEDWVLGSAFSKDGAHLVTVSRDRSMKLIQVATQQFIDNITSITPGALKGGLMSVDRHPSNDTLLIGGSDGVPKIYNMFRTQERKIGDDFNLVRAFEPMEGRIFTARFSPDGTRIAAGSSFQGGGEVRLLLAADGARVQTWKFPCAVYALAFHPSGKVLAAGGFDGTVRLLDCEHGGILKEFPAVPASP